MKQILLIISVLIITLSMSSKVTAQYTFENFEALNRVLMFKYIETADQEVKKEVLELFKGMSKKIEGVEWVHVADLSTSTQGFEQAITITFNSKEGLDTYISHPDHIRIKEIAPSIVEDFAMYEYWEQM